MGADSIHAVAQSAQKVARTSSFTRLLARFLPRRNRARFLEWYAYLRWVDDLVDEGVAPGTSSAEFIERQIMLLTDGTLPKSAFAREEHFLSIVLRSGNPDGESLRTLTLDVLSSISFDQGRRGKFFRHSELRSYWKREVRGYLGTIAVFCGVRFDNDPPGIIAAEAAKIIHVIRDLQVDVAQKQFNASVEELETYGLDFSAPFTESDEHFARFMLTTLSQAQAQLSVGLSQVREVRSLRYRLIVALLVTKYQWTASTIRNRLICERRWGGRRYVLRQLVANAAVALLRRRTSQPSPKAVTVTALPVFDRARLASTVLPWSAGGDIRHLVRLLARSGCSLTEPRKVKRRFRVARMLGRLSFSAVSSAAHDHRLRDGAGLLFALWATAAIELDRLMDEQLLDAAAAHRVAAAWLNLQSSALAGNLVLEHEALAVTSDVFRALTEGFMSALADFSAGCRACQTGNVAASSRNSFQAATEALMDGQMASYGQARNRAAATWPWYRSHILNTKNVQFLLAPMHLWVVNAGAGPRLQRLKSIFDELNRYYLHYQLIDDVADLDEDAQSGIVGAPGAILITQAKLALALLKGELAEPSAVEAGARSTGLLDGGVSDGAMYDAYRHLFGSISRTEQAIAGPALLRCALENDPADRELESSELARTRIAQAEAYLAALDRGDWCAAGTVLRQSGTPGRLVAAVGTDTNRYRACRTFESEKDTQLRQFAFLLEQLMRHTYAAAVQTLQ